MTLEQFFAEKSGEQARLLSTLHEWLSTFSLRCKMRYNIPFYDQHSWICYLSPKGEAAVELCFIHGLKLTNTDGLLVAGGRKMISGVLLHDVKAIPWVALEEVLLEAIWLDEQLVKEKK